MPLAASMKEARTALVPILDVEEAAMSWPAPPRIPLRLVVLMPLRIAVNLPLVGL